MKAIVINKGGSPDVLELREIEPPPLQPGQARVRLKAAGINHRDVWQRVSYPGPGPMIFGSDGAGIVEAVGSTADDEWLGREVVINPSLHWGDREDAPGADYQVLGNPTFGTYAESVAVPAINLTGKPEHLDYLQAASFPLAGLTAWRALFTQGGLMPGHTVLLPGIGSGVAGWALLFAKIAGARVIVTSSTAGKLEKAAAQGADFGVNYTDERWEQEVRDYAGSGGIDMVLDHSGEKTISSAIRLVRPGGRVVFLGVTTGEQLIVGLRETYFKQVHLVGTMMGSPREFDALCRFIAQHKITPEINHTFPLADAAEAHRLMEAGGQYGKIMLTI